MGSEQPFRESWVPSKARNTQAFKSVRKQLTWVPWLVGYPYRTLWCVECVVGRRWDTDMKRAMPATHCAVLQSRSDCSKVMSKTRNRASNPSDEIGDVVRLKPYQYIHVHDNNTNCSRVVVGPTTFTKQEHEQVCGTEAMEFSVQHDERLWIPNLKSSFLKVRVKVRNVRSSLRESYIVGLQPLPKNAQTISRWQRSQVAKGS